MEARRRRPAYSTPTLPALVLLLCTHCVVAKPLEVQRPPTQQQEGEGNGKDGVPVCVTALQGRIEGCLQRYERVLVTYQAPGTSREARGRLTARLCHQYQVTLQCLHESLMSCPPQPEHFTLIEVRLGYLKSFMITTCTPPDDLTPQHSTPPSTTTGAPATSTTTTTSTGSTTATTPTTTTTTTVTTSTASTPRPLPARIELRKFENNSLWRAHTMKSGITTGGPTRRTGTTATAGPAVLPPGGKHTTQAPTGLQLLFGHHGPSVQLASATKRVGLDHTEGHEDTPISTISRGNSVGRVIQGKLVAQKVDCTVDRNNKIDVRCLYSGSQRQRSTVLPVLVSLTIATMRLIHRR